MFKNFFHMMDQSSSPSHFVETLYSCGVSGKILESLPEAVLTPIRDAIAACQPQPPASWSKGLLELVNRSDINLALAPAKVLRHPGSNVLVSCSAISSSCRS